MVTCNFTYTHYFTTVKTFLDNGFQLQTACQSSDADRVLRLVHDVDFLIEPAMELATLEADRGVFSTYYFRLHSAGYNLFAYQTQRKLDALEALGHSVGLHFESVELWNPGAGSEDTPLRQSDNAILDEVEDRLTMISNLLGRRFKTFNLHEPSRSRIGAHSEGETNRSYNSPFYAEYKYLSDSGGRWREMCFCQATKKFSKLLVLTHGEWWFDKAPNQSY